MLELNCTQCGEIVLRYNSKRERKRQEEGANTFCNHTCQGEYQRSKNNPLWGGGCVMNIILLQMGDVNIGNKNCQIY